ncbi:unnamed protein product, partial [Mesorhabditis spiculigera]
MRQVTVEYDFNAQPGSGEMTVHTGEVLTIIRDKVDGGWLEAKNARGDVGLVPETYVGPYNPPAHPPHHLIGVEFDCPGTWGRRGTPGNSVRHSRPTLPSIATVFPFAMLFTSGLRKAVEQMDPDVAKALADRRAKQMRRRHTCAAFKTENPLSSPQRQPKPAVGRNVLLEEEEESISAPMVVPPISSIPSAPSSFTKPASTFDDWGTPAPFIPPSYSQNAPPGHETIQQPAAGSQVSPNDDFDDEWTDDDDDAPEAPQPARGGGGGYQGAAPIHPQSSLARTQSTTSGIAAQNAKVSRSINRFTQFVKSGMESYVLSDAQKNFPASEKLAIIMSDHGPIWRPVDQYYTCTVDKPKKETKLGGLKKFIAYSLTSSITGIQVSRRYKHFDWFHEQLQSKFIMIPIPPLPEKQVSGLYEEDLIDHRKHILQLYVNKICRHPVISRAEVWLHFMSCTDEKQWKTGKRKAEKDEFVGGNFLFTVQFPEQPLQMHEVERQVEQFQRGVRSMEDSVRVMHERLTGFQKLYAGPVKQNWQRMAAAFQSLGKSFEIDATAASAKMVEALHRTGNQYNHIGDEIDRHTKEDIEPVLENLYSYKGTIQNVPDILGLHKQAIGKLREAEGKVSQSDVDRIKKRVDNTSYIVMAEMNHLNSEKIEDYKHVIGAFLKQQAECHQRTANMLNEMAKLYS